MTETDELRRMLDERGVEWTSERVSDGVLFTFTKDGRTYSVFARDRAGLEMWSQYLTPAQAIEATLGPEPDDAAMVKLHEQMNTALLEYERAQGIEMRDGDAAITVPFVAKMHELLEEAATLGRGTCHLISAPQYGDGCQECSSCGAVMDGYLFDGGNCPNCGAKVVKE